MEQRIAGVTAAGSSFLSDYTTANAGSNSYIHYDNAGQPCATDVTQCNSDGIYTVSPAMEG